jgi:putative SOS response-associated peptidase YedK
MCGRYAFFSPAEAVKQVFGVDSVPTMEPHYNLAPTQDVPVLREVTTGQRQVALLHWGLIPSWAKEQSVGNRMINARAETLTERPAFRRAFRDRRCLVLADGWYEWQATASGKQPWFIRHRDGLPIGFAGLWESWRDPASNQTMESCTIITVDASSALARIHDRTPAVIGPAAAGTWLDPARHDTAALAALLAPVNGQEFQAYPVSRAVNSPRNEGAELIAPEREG